MQAAFYRSLMSRVRTLSIAGRQKKTHPSRLGPCAQYMQTIHVDTGQNACVLVKNVQTMNMFIQTSYIMSLAFQLI